MECYKCNKGYAPDPERVRQWGESDEDFDPTDWECPECAAGEGQPTNIFDECLSCVEEEGCDCLIATCCLCRRTVLMCNAYGTDNVFYCGLCDPDKR